MAPVLPCTSSLLGHWDFSCSAGSELSCWEMGLVLTFSTGSLIATFTYIANFPYIYKETSTWHEKISSTGEIEIKKHYLDIPLFGSFRDL